MRPWRAIVQGYQREITMSKCHGRRSSRQGCNPAGGSPAVSVARVGYVAIPQPVAGNQAGYGWCKRPGHPEDFLREMGGRFAFLGSQYRLGVDGREFFIDLLLFHR